MDKISMKNIVLQQKEELRYLTSQQYQLRKPIEDPTPFINSGVIKLITGPRRAGKSTYALQLLQGKNFGYLNFDDKALLDRFDEDAVTQALAEVYPGYTHLLLAEVQNLDGWNLWVDKLKRRGTNLVITGSNAKMLSSEMATVLTGRYVELLMLPFSMKESLEFRNVKIVTNLPASKAELMLEIEAYMKYGGLPEINRTREITKSYAGSLFDSIILKDVAQRHRIRKTQDLYSLADYLISNYCTPLSYNNISEALGIGSVTTVKKFCDFLSEPYLFFFLPRFSSKLRQMKKAPQKVYVVDNAFILARSFELSSNTGRQLENTVFAELLRKGSRPGDSLFYYRTRNDREIDFAVRSGNQVRQLIQVCLDMSSVKTSERELKALAEASGELHCDCLKVITWDTDDTIDYNGKTIDIIPASKWFLQN